MAKTKQGKKDVDSYTIRGTNKVVRVGDCVLMRDAVVGLGQPAVRGAGGADGGRRARQRAGARALVLPPRGVQGRPPPVPRRQLFLSDHFDLQSAHTIEDKCIVHSFKNYTKLDNVGAEDFFCRFEYKAASGAFTPDRVAVYCKCEMPYNPDDLMIQCDACKDWFHLSCMSMGIEQAKKLDHFICSDCIKDTGSKRLPNAFDGTPNSEPKSESKGRGGNNSGYKHPWPRRRAAIVAYQPFHAVAQVGTVQCSRTSFCRTWAAVS